MSHTGHSHHFGHEVRHFRFASLLQTYRGSAPTDEKGQEEIVPEALAEAAGDPGGFAGAMAFF